LGVEGVGGVLTYFGSVKVGGGAEGGNVGSEGLYEGWGDVVG